MLKIMVCDDHELVRAGLRAMVSKHPDWELVAEAVDGYDAIQQAESTHPDIVIMDVGMPNLNGLEATRHILKLNPQPKVLILSMHESEQIVHDVLQAGARGYLLKSDAGRDLISAIQSLAAGNTYFTSKIADYILNGFKSGIASEEKKALTGREREILQLLAEGASTKDVAVRMGLSVKTIETHRANIMRKLKIHSISELVLYAVRNGVIHIQPDNITVPVPKEISTAAAAMASA
jgi:DNA-binding NarL/FixJ family response regulator